jgi:hypothetical protein
MAVPNFHCDNCYSEFDVSKQRVLVVPSRDLAAAGVDETESFRVCEQCYVDGTCVICGRKNLTERLERCVGCQKRVCEFLSCRPSVVHNYCAHCCCVNEGNK